MQYLMSLEPKTFLWVLVTPDTGCFPVILTSYIVFLSPFRNTPRYYLYRLGSIFKLGYQQVQLDIGPLRAVVFNLFCSRTPRYNLSSTLYPQSCWYIMQVIHIV
jgi:hypothetical protein